MQFTIVAALFAAMAIAVPTDYKEPKKGEPTSDGDKCQQQQNTKQACCSTDSSSKGGLIGGIADGLLGGSCTLNILGATCSPDQVLACCSTSEQTGLINVGTICVPITV